MLLAARGKGNTLKPATISTQDVGGNRLKQQLKWKRKIKYQSQFQLLLN
jgi:hypothetical protein